MAINYDRGSNDLEEVIDKLQKQKKYLQGQLRKTKSNRAEEIMALYAEVKRLKNLNESLQKDIHHKDLEIGRLMSKVKV